MATGDKSLTVQGVEVHMTTRGDEDYISLTDMASSFEGAEQQIKNWLQNRGTIEFLAVWEQINNPGFNLVGFHQIRSEAASQRFIMSVKKWADLTSGVGVIARAGRYGGTFAHKDIAFRVARTAIRIEHAVSAHFQAIGAWAMLNWARKPVVCLPWLVGVGNIIPATCLYPRDERHATAAEDCICICIGRLQRSRAQHFVGR